MPIAQGLEYAEAAATAAAGEQQRLGRPERQHPGVAVDRRPLARVRAVLRQQVEALGLHVGREGRVRPRLVGRRPVSGGARPDARTTERRSHLHHVPARNSTTG